MKFLSRIRSLLANLLHKETVEHSLDDELQAYVEMVADEKTLPASRHLKRAEPPWRISAESSR